VLNNYFCNLHCHSREETVSQLPFLSFRASEARHGIQYFQQVLDAGFRRHDGVDSTFYYYDTVSKAGIRFFVDFLDVRRSLPSKFSIGDGQ